MANAPREFQVLKDNGEHWIMQYTSTGVAWSRSKGPLEASRSTPQLGSPWQGGAGPLQAVAAVADTAAKLGLWWEIRQQRLLNEARHEEDRRIPWLADMLSRWGEAHRSGGQLDLRVSEYLAREASETMNAIVANRRVSVPQSMLYELELVQETLRSFRVTMLSQFESLAANNTVDLDVAIREVLPSSKLNMAFIREVGRDPGVEWAERLRSRTSGGFDSQFGDAFRHPEIFLSRVFASTALDFRPEASGNSRDTFVEWIVGLVTNALPEQRVDEAKGAALERLDGFRELVLLRSEVSRVKALHSAWIATSEIVTRALGYEARVEVGSQGVAVNLDPADSARATA